MASRSGRRRWGARVPSAPGSGFGVVSARRPAGRCPAAV